jgi:acetyl-CoA acetyltransferase
MARKVLVAGVGMTPFAPLGGLVSAASLAQRAIRAALDDARVDVDLIDQAYSAYVYGGVGLGDSVLATVGLGGIPLFSSRDGCAAGTAAFQQARQALLAGEAECALVVGFDAMPAGISSNQFFALDEVPQPDWDALLGRDEPLAALQRRQFPAALYAAQTHWLLTHMDIHEDSFARVANRARQQAGLNPFALMPAAEDGTGWLPPYLCRPASGAAALLLCTDEFARRYGLRAEVAVLASVRGSDTAAELEAISVLDVLGRAVIRKLAQQAYETAGVGAEELDLVELHDQSIGDHMITSAALGLCAEEQINRFVREGLNSQGRRVSVCPSGGLLGRGHAPGATGVAQLVEIVWQLRGEAKSRQVEGARTALQQSSSLGRAVSVSILQSIR